MTTSPTFLDLLKQRVMVYDGAMGTSIQNYALTVEGDFEGKENCGEILVVTRPDVIREIHASYLEAGADVIETDSFGGSSLVLAEFGIAHRARELNMAAARLAKDVAREYSTADKPRFVAGSMGPTTKLPSLGHIGYDAMLASYVEQAEALIEGGVDMLLIETCQDLLQLKIALAACSDAMKKTGVTLPVQAQITMEATGTMLLGSEIGAALAVLECFRPDVVGSQLRDRAGGDERRGALPVPERDHADQRAAQRGTAAECGRTRRLQADAGGVCRAPSPVCVGVRRAAWSADAAAPRPRTSRPRRRLWLD